MAGPTSMMLGPFPFQALGFGYDAVGRRVQTPWADIAVAQTLNQQQWTGPTSEEVTIRGVLFPAEWAASLDGLIAAANQGSVLILASGNQNAGVIHGPFTIQSVDEDRSFHDAAGRPWRNAYTLTLRRYANAAGSLSVEGSILNALRNLVSIV